MGSGLIIDGFAGAGGASSGIARAMGRDPDYAINHNAEALAVHEANHPDTVHLWGNIWDTNPTKLCAGRPVDVAWFSPTCFPAGTLVLTRTGMRGVEAVTIGDEVLTHKNRWRRVTATSSRVAETISLRGQGHYGLVTTPDHKFYSKRITHRNSRMPHGGPNDPTTPRRTLIENPFWPEAADMLGRHWATPISFPDSSIPTTDGAAFSDDFFYFVGRWLGDGCLSKGDVEICTGAADFAHMKSMFECGPLRRASGEVVVPRDVHRTPSCPSLAWGNAPLARWLEEHFGALSDGKRIPIWALSMQRSWREAMLRGYVDADGSINDGVTSTTSVSRQLSIGFRLIAASLGHAACLYKTDGKPGVIEGRSFMGRDAYVVKWRADHSHSQPLRDATHMFALVKEVASTGRTEEVFCLEVEEDHSYVADGIVVHNCTDFSRAKGAPLDQAAATRVRALAWVVIRWAREVRPRIIQLENVREFAGWTRLDPDGKRDPKRLGLTFKMWLGKLKALGYAAEYRELKACDYGAPTSRNRLYLIARRDGLPIVWPRPTHGPGLLPYRTAADCIDWSLPCPSIFEPGRDLVDATLRRVARGVRKFVIDAAEPFVIPVSHSGDDRVQSISEPMRTITASSRSPFALISPSLVHLSNGERPGQAPRTYDIREPLSTVVAGGTKHGLVAAFLAKHYGGHTTPGAQLDLPLSTITTQDHHAVVQVHTKANPDRSEQVWAFLSQYNGTSIGAQLNLPMPTVTTKDRFALVTVRGEQFRIADIGMRMLTPRELANGQGFPRDYIIDRGPNGKTLSKTAQVRCIGNSVCPDVAEALVRANWADAAADRRVA